MTSRVMQLFKEDWCDDCGGYMDEGEDFRFANDGEKICEKCWPENKGPEPTFAQVAQMEPVLTRLAEHHCHWPLCTVPVPPKMWGCGPHWSRLPKFLRDLIWATYVPGQEITKTPSTAYLDAAFRVQEWIAETSSESQTKLLDSPNAELRPQLGDIQKESTMTTTPVDNPFAKEGGLPSVSFGGKDPVTGGITSKPLGTKYRLQVTKLPSKVQSRDFATGKPSFWDPNKQGAKTLEPNDKPIMSVVVNGKYLAGSSPDVQVGTEAALWAQIPSSSFAAIGDAINAAGVPAIEVGGILEIELVGFKQGEDANRAAAKQYKAAYFPPNAFQGEAAPAAQPVLAAAAPVLAAAPQLAAPVLAPVVVTPVLVEGFTKEQWIAAGATDAHFNTEARFAPFKAAPAPVLAPVLAPVADAPIDVEAQRAAAIAKLSPEDRALLYGAS